MPSARPCLFLFDCSCGLETPRKEELNDKGETIKDAKTGEPVRVITIEPRRQEPHVLAGGLRDMMLSAAHSAILIGKHFE